MTQTVRQGKTKCAVETFQTVQQKFHKYKADGTSKQLFPIQYFLRYIPEELFKAIAMYTNMYAMQNGIKFKSTTKYESQTLFALHIIIYWNLNKFQ